MCHHLIEGLADDLDIWWGVRSAWFDAELAALPQGFCRVAVHADPRVWLRRREREWVVEGLRLHARPERSRVLQAHRLIAGAFKGRPTVRRERGEPDGDWILAELDRIAATRPGVRVH